MMTQENGAMIVIYYGIDDPIRNDNNDDSVTDTGYTGER